jgi:predicted ATP-grasp superfamily ATP-dependent carboligase
MPLCDSQRPYAIIIGLDSLPGIQAARILSQHDIPVIAIARRPKHYCCRTRVCQKILFADTQTDAFVELLETLGPSFEQKAILFPCTDMTVWQISQQRQRLEPWYHMALPDPKVVETLMSKEHFHTYAHQAGFRVPRTCILHTRSDVERVVNDLTFPCILKPVLRTPTWTQYSPSKVFRALHAEDLILLYERCSQWVTPLVVQEWIEGPDANLFSCNCYFDKNAELVATFISHKLRQWPPQTGITSLGEECRNDDVLHETLRLFQGVQYSGLGYVEMKRDERTGEYFVLEANIGRPTVRSAIAEAGGVELLYAMYCDLAGWPLPTALVQTYQGVKWLNLHYDLRSAFSYWRNGELSLRQWWESWQGRKVHALFSWQDPAPFIADIVSTLVRGIRRRGSAP